MYLTPELWANLISSFSTAGLICLQTFNDYFGLRDELPNTFGMSDLSLPFDSSFGLITGDNDTYWGQ